MKNIVSKFIQASVAASLFSLSISAAALPPATGKVILTVSGKVGDKNAGANAEFDLAMLEKLPQHTYTTQTPWDKQPIKFTGPLLRDVLAAAKATGTTLKAAALNDFKTEIPVQDATKYDMLLAHKMNGESIPVRTKGPLFIVYPYDTKPELQNNTYYERSAWQLKSIDVQ